MATVIKCNCVHEFQDRIYGKGMRLANEMGDNNGYRCTVCGKEYKPNSGGKK